MVSYRPHHHYRKWIARRRRNDIEYYLGAFKTYGEALAAEQKFEKAVPSRRGAQRER